MQRKSASWPGLLWWLGAVVVASAASADTRFDVAVDRVEIQGAAPFLDTFDDGRRDAPPTSRFIDRGTTIVREQGGALRLTDDDGSDGDIGIDHVVLDRPLREGAGAARLRVDFAADAGTAVRGVVLESERATASEAGRRILLLVGRGPIGPAPAGAGPLNQVAPFHWPPDHPFSLRWAMCGTRAQDVIVFGEDADAACDVLPAGASGHAIQLRIDVSADGALDAAYSLDAGATWVPSSEWSSPGLAHGIQAGERLFPGLVAFARSAVGARQIDYAGTVAGSGILRDSGGAVVRVDGSLSRERVPTRPKHVPSGGDGTFRIQSSDTRDLRIAAGTIELFTPRGMLRAVADPLPPEEMAVCEAAVVSTSLSPSSCARSSPESTEVGLLGRSAVDFFQSWSTTVSPPVQISPTQPQPGTVGFQAGPACVRVVSGSYAILPGCRNPGDPGFDPVTDGTTSGVGFPIGSPSGSPIGPAFGNPFTGHAWRSERAALSFNQQMLLVASSDPVGTSGIDPLHTFDATNAYRPDACSFRKPHACNLVDAVRGLAVDVLPDDPEGESVRRWVWEVARSHRVVEATGDFAALLGGWIHAVGPFQGELPDAAAQVAFFAARATLIDVELDGIDDAKDRCPDRFDAMQEDADGDRVGDACDVCIRDFDPLQRDSDGDGHGNRCDADFDGDGVVDFRDLQVLRTRMYQRDPHVDLDGDGVVGFRDLAILKQRFLLAPGPSAARP